MQLSVIIITRNEETNIGDCLKSVAFADEVIVLDNASSDRTREIATSMGARVHVAPDWPGFGPQKNRALALAKGKWVLSIDADERVSPELRAEILQVMNSETRLGVYALARRSSYCGQFILHSGWNPDHVLRLFRRDQARFSEDLVHEKLLFDGTTGLLDSTLLHLSFPDFESVLEKMNRYSSAGAQVMHLRSEGCSLASALGHGCWAFIRTYLLQRGFMDGQLGLALAISNAEGTYYRYAKRWLMERLQVKPQQ